MTSYRAAICTALTGPDSIEIKQQEALPLEPGQVRVGIKSAGLNFPDLLMTYGKYQFRPDPPFVPGMDAAGDILEVAADVSHVAIGDRVMAGSKGGTFAEQLVTAGTQCSLLPAALSYEDGSCWRTAAATAWNGLIERGRLKASDSVFILGASGGVGMAAVKLAKLEGAMVIGTGSTPEKRDVILNAGADFALDPKDPDLAKQVKELTKGKGADIVYDPVGGDLAITATRSIAFGGRYLIIGFASGAIPSFPANHILIKTYEIIGVRAGESPRRDPDMAKRQNMALSKLADVGALRPNISHRFNLEHVSAALIALENREVIGRAVINIAV